MIQRPAILGLALAAGLSSTAGAVTLTTDFNAFVAAVGANDVADTVNTGLGNPFALFLPTTSVVPLADGQSVGLTNMAQVTQPQNGYPYAFSDGFSGDVLIPVDASGNQLTSETIIPQSGSLTAFGFEFVPFSDAAGEPNFGVPGGPYSFTITLSTGQGTSVTLPGGNFNTGTTTPAFVGYYGGPVTSLTITTTDPNGFAIGNFFDVPEPASLFVLAIGLLGLGFVARRNA